MCCHGDPSPGADIRYLGLENDVTSGPEVAYIIFAWVGDVNVNPSPIDEADAGTLDANDGANEVASSGLHRNNSELTTVSGLELLSKSMQHPWSLLQVRLLKSPAAPKGEASLLKFNWEYSWLPEIGGAAPIVMCPEGDDTNWSLFLTNIWFPMGLITGSDGLD